MNFNLIHDNLISCEWITEDKSLSICWNCNLQLGNQEINKYSIICMQGISCTSPKISIRSHWQQQAL